MTPSLLKLLRCPFCAGELHVDGNRAVRAVGDDLLAGVLYCECCAYPVLAGIPFVRVGANARQALRCLEQRQPDEALAALLGLEDSPGQQLHELLSDSPALTFRQALARFGAESERSYLVHRFSDPTYVVSEVSVRALDEELAKRPGRVLDLGGGAGHFARCLGELRCATDVVLADLEFWRLWLAKRFVAPAAQPVCCDANAPLPFAQGAFSVVFCSDALNYIWQRRLAVSEMLRLRSERGILMVSHLHNALCDNPSPGMSLTPAGWRNLFEGLAPRLYAESRLLAAALTPTPLPFSEDPSDEALKGEAALLAIATGRPDLLRDFPPSLLTPPAKAASVNPLYQVEPAGTGRLLRLHFPSPDYEAEFGACRSYLPERAELSAGQTASLESGVWDAALDELFQRRVLLDLPARYL